MPPRGIDGTSVARLAEAHCDAPRWGTMLRVEVSRDAPQGDSRPPEPNANDRKCEALYGD